MRLAYFGLRDAPVGKKVLAAAPAHRAPAPSADNS